MRAETARKSGCLEIES